VLLADDPLGVGQRQEVFAGAPDGHAVFLETVFVGGFRIYGARIYCAGDQQLDGHSCLMNLAEGDRSVSVLSVCFRAGLLIHKCVFSARRRPRSM
jgi:hypothetical protein